MSAKRAALVQHRRLSGAENVSKGGQICQKGVGICHKRGPNMSGKRVENVRKEGRKCQQKEPTMSRKRAENVRKEGRICQQRGPNMSEKRAEYVRKEGPKCLQKEPKMSAKGAALVQQQRLPEDGKCQPRCREMSVPGTKNVSKGVRK